MIMIKLLQRVFIFLGLTFFLISPIYAQQRSGERILDYHSDITIHKDSTMTVTETISVRCERVNINRGIYRDFPTRYKDRYGNRVIVGFEVLNVTRDSNREPYHIENRRNGKRVYIGHEDIYLDKGKVYTYSIRYKTTRQLGFFEKHDELYWNVTGNGWGFTIDKATADVHLPGGILADDISLFGYTGYEGEKGESYSAFVEQGTNVCKFETTGKLISNKGLTIVVEFPKGIVTEPTPEERFQYFLQDNIVFVIGLAAIAILLIYYLIVWAAVGRDMPKGTIIPRFDPPENISPAAMRFIKRMGYDNKAFAASIINMAVKGFINISDKNNIYTLERRLAYELIDNYDLSDGEEAIAETLLMSKKTIKLVNKNHIKISGAIRKLRESLVLTFEDIYFVTNRGFMVLGILISIATFIGIIIGLGQQGGAESVMVFVFGSIFGGAGLLVFIFQAIPLWRTFLFGVGNRIASFIAAVFTTMFLLVFFGIGLMVFVLEESLFSHILLGLVMAVIILINVIFYHLLKAPTAKGRKIIDQIEGFKMYLSYAEKDRLNTLNPPEKTPELFEKFLPYALALDVEQQWSEEFADVLEAASKEGRRYSPAWYSGNDFNRLGAAGFASSVGKSVSGAISSSSHAPGSKSGGGGGGFSGGGGGGGGGGGW